MSRQPDPWKSLRDEFRKLQDQIRRMQAASPFFGTGVHPNGNQGLDSDNYVPATSGFSLDGGTGVAEFKDIILYDLPNSMLANPVIPGSVWQEATGFTVTPSWSTVISVSVTVPADCTSASISAKGRVTAFYNNAGTGSGIDYLYANLFIGSLSSDYYPTAVSDNGGSGANHVFRDAVLTGLTPGSAIVLSLQASTGYTTWTAPSSPGNKAKLGAAIQWYR